MTRIYQGNYKGGLKKRSWAIAKSNFCKRLKLTKEFRKLLRKWVRNFNQSLSWVIAELDQRFIRSKQQI